MSISGLSEEQIEQFRVLYRNEAFELLEDLEQALLDLDDNYDDQELLGRVFSRRPQTPTCHFSPPP